MHDGRDQHVGLLREGFAKSPAPADGTGVEEVLAVMGIQHGKGSLPCRNVDAQIARRQALEEKRRRIEALKAQKAERARQAATSQKSAASAAANLRSYVDGLLSQKSEAPAPAAPVSTPNGTQLPPPPPPAAPRASTSPRYERKVVDVLAAATQTESHEDVDEAAAAQARLEAVNSERALQNRSNSSSDSARKKTADIHKVEKKPVDLSSLSSRAKLVEKCLGERDVSRGFRGGDLRLGVSRARLRGGERYAEIARARLQSLQALDVVFAQSR